MIRRPAEQLNVDPEALRNWIRQDQVDQGERADRPSTAIIEENRCLARENAELRRDNEVLWAASVFRGGDRPDPEEVAWDIDKAQVANKGLRELDYGAKYLKAVAKIVDDMDVLLEFYKYPAEHWHYRSRLQRA